MTTPEIERVDTIESNIKPIFVDEEYVFTCILNKEVVTTVIIVA